MKKINLLIAAGLLASASMQAQVVASLGFEDSDPKERTSQWALTHQDGSFGDWVNKTDDDVWTEQFADDVMEGEYAFQAVNAGSETLASWMRAFKFVLPEGAIKENTPYRVSFWLKAPEGGHITSWLSQGTENYDKSFCTADNQNFGIADMTLNGEDWQHVSFCSFYQAADTLNNVIKDQDWVGNAVFPEDFGGDGTKLYREYFDFKLPNEYFFMVAMRTGGTYLLDDIKIEQGVTYNQVQFGQTTVSSEAVVKFDFGFPTNIAALAGASETGALSLDPSCVTVTLNGAPATVKYLEGKADGFLYAFLDLGEDGEGDPIGLEDDDVVVVSFTPAADCPIIYSSSLRPSSDRFSEMKVLAIAGAAAEYSGAGFDVASLEAGPGKFVSSIPENESFEIVAETFKQISVTYDKELDLYETSAVLSWNNGTQELDLSDNLTLSEDGKTINIALGTKLADGEYTLFVRDVWTKFDAVCPEVQLTFAVGPDNDQTVSKTVFNTDSTFAATAADTFPLGWVSNDNGTIHQYGINEDGTVYNYSWSPKNPGGLKGGSRGFTGFSGDIKGTAIYWRNFDSPATLGTLTFGAQVNDYKLNDGTIDPEMDPNLGLYLDAGKYQITILMCAWKNLDGNVAPIYDFTLEDLNGNVYASFKDVQAMPNMNGGRGAVNNATKSQTDFNVSTPGYYVLKFASTQGAAELLLGSVNIITMPSKAAYWKQQLASAAQTAKGILDTAEDAKYDGDTKTALSTAYESATTGHFTSPSEIQALMDLMDAEGEKLQTRMKNIDDFNDNIDPAKDAYYGKKNAEDETKWDVAPIAGTKYEAVPAVQDAKATIETYAEANPSELSDEELNEVAPKLVAAAAKLGNVKSCSDLLTFGIGKAVATAKMIGTNDAAAFQAALDAVTDDRKVADNLNAANKKRLYEHIVNGELADSIMTTLMDNIQTDSTVTVGVEWTGAIYNPKFYRVYGNDNTFTGWTLALNKPGFAGDTPTEVKYVTGGGFGNGSCGISSWGNNKYDLQQVIENLPAGIYDVELDTRTVASDPSISEFGYNAQNDTTGVWDMYTYAQGDADDAQQVKPYRQGSSGSSPVGIIKGVKVKDGTITFGAHEEHTSGKYVNNNGEVTDFWTGTSQVSNARLFFVAPLPGYDYAKALEDMVTAIEDINATVAAKKNGVMYNLAGQRVGADYRGFVIINGKKYMKTK